MTAVHTLDTACSTALQRVRAEIHCRTEQARLATVVDFAQARSRLGIGPVVIPRAMVLNLPAFMRCPECGGRVIAAVFDHDPDTGIPSREGLHLCCPTLVDEFYDAAEAGMPPLWTHDWLPSVWATVNRLAAEWLHLNVRVKP